jgi:hypothetical protein
LQFQVDYLRTEIERIEAIAFVLETDKPDVPEIELTGLLDYQIYMLALDQSRCD